VNELDVNLHRCDVVTFRNIPNVKEGDRCTDVDGKAMG